MGGLRWAFTFVIAASHFLEAALNAPCLVLAADIVKNLGTAGLGRCESLADHGFVLLVHIQTAPANTLAPVSHQTVDGLFPSGALRRPSRERVSRRRRPASSRCPPNLQERSLPRPPSSIDFARPVTWESTMTASSLSSKSLISRTVCTALRQSRHSRTAVWAAPSNSVSFTEARMRAQLEGSSVVRCVALKTARCVSVMMRRRVRTSASSGGTTLVLDAAGEVMGPSPFDATEDAGSEAPSMAARQGRNGSNRAPLPLCVCVCEQCKTLTKCAKMFIWKWNAFAIAATHSGPRVLSQMVPQ